MKRFDSRLSRLLRYEQQLEKDAEWASRQAQLEFEQSKAHTASILERIDDVLSGMVPHVSVGLTLSIRDAGLRYLNLLEQAVKQSRQAENKAEQTAEDALGRLNEVMQRRRSLEILIDKQQKQYQKQVGRHQQLVLDGIAIQKWTKDREDN